MQTVGINASVKHKRRITRPNDVDRWIGMRMRERRIMLGLTQQQLAENLDCTYQQQHKREKGTNRISGGNLYKTAQALGVDVSYFFDGLNENNPKPNYKKQRRLLNLTRNFLSLDEAKQEAVAVFMNKIADREGEIS